AADLLDQLFDGAGDPLEHVWIVAEYLDFNRRRRTLEIAEHVLQQLGELDFSERRRFDQLGAHRGDDLFRRSVALTARLQSHENVARGLGRGEETQLRSGPA